MNDPRGAPGVHVEFVDSLAQEEKDLLVLRKILYEGSWDDMKRDLRSRRSGKPFIFKLNTRIDEDLERIEKLEDYEQQHKINLLAYLEDKPVDA